MGRKVVALLDSGAAVSAVTEELIVGCINRARDYGLGPEDPAYPIAQLERYSESEAVAHATGCAVRFAASEPTGADRGADPLRGVLCWGERLARVHLGREDAGHGRARWFGLEGHGQALPFGGRGRGPAAHGAGPAA
eukprot:15483686-Alexandrium_andersonii.AAC.1